MTAVQEALRDAAHRIARTGSDETSLEAELLLAHALGADRTHLFQRLRDELSPQVEGTFDAFVQRRLNREPTAYIVGHKEFYGLAFEVTPAAIVPRQETETLIDLFLDFVRSRDDEDVHIADVGVGCGAIAVTLAVQLSQAQVSAIDVSRDALDLARRNAERHHVAGRIRFLEGDLLTPLSAHPEPGRRARPEPSRRADVIAANLPYVRTADLDAAPPEISEHEPRVGLDGGPDGLHLIGRLLEDAPPSLNPRGALFAEIGDDQGDAACTRARAAFPDARIEVHRDLSGLDRVLAVKT